MKKLVKRSVLVTILCLLAVSNIQAMAATKKQLNSKALTEYKRVLEKGYYTYTSYGHTWKTELKEFTIIDINRDGIKEMITRTSRYSQMDIWVLKGKKAARILSFMPYQGTSIGYSKKNKALSYAISMTVTTDADGFIKMKSRTATNLFEYGTRWENGRSIPLWYINGKKVSSKTFKKKVNPKNFADVKEVLFYSNYVWNVNRLGKLKAY